MSVYIPPATSNGGQCSGGCSTTDDAKYSYLSGYFNAHMLSMSSHRYEYITWIVISLVVVVLAAFRHLGIADQSYVGAVWHRWAVKNRVIKIGRKETLSDDKMVKRRRVFTFPSFGRTLLLIALIVVPVVLTIIGADYIRPSANVFNMKESWPPSNISPYTAGLNRRLEWGQGSYPLVTTNAPSITLPYRTWWTAGGRTGAMTNALTPFIVVIALKQIPFALLSTKLLGGYAFDRLSFMHKWGGRVVWLYATSHVVLWSVQLAKDQAFNGPIWGFVFMWTRFRWGWVSYCFFTLLVLLSVGPIRSNYYEFFYVAHVICVIGFMVTAWLHHPPLGAWMYATLLWWLLERIVRAIKVAYINGIGFRGRQKAQMALVPQSARFVDGGRMLQHKAAQMSLSAASSHTMHSDSNTTYLKSFGPPSSSQQYTSFAQGGGGGVDADSFPERRKTRMSAMYDPVSDLIEGYAGGENEGNAIALKPMNASARYTLRDEGPTKDSSIPSQSSDTLSVRPSSPQSSFHTSADHYARTIGTPARTPHVPRPAMGADVAAVLRPGYAYAQLLPGKTLRLTIRTPNRMSWRPGQYVNLSVPKVGWWQSHPFTIASHDAGYLSSSTTTKVASSSAEDAEKGLVGKAEAMTVGGGERTIVLLLRARWGFTHKLWDHVRVERERQIRHIEETTGMQYAHGDVAKTATGVHIRALIDGPFGSVQGTRWGIHSSVMIICGGSGISYGMAVLEYLCTMMAGVRRERKFVTRRVRFVWILREYSHLQWVASALRRCVEMVPPEMLQVELFVTSDRVRRAANMQTSQQYFSANAMQHSDDPYHLGHTYDDLAGLQQPRFTEGPEQEEYELDANDLTQFDGEDCSAPTAAEAKISERVHKEGKLRRAHTRRATMKRNNRRHGDGGGAGERRRDASREREVMRTAQRGIHQQGQHPAQQTHYERLPYGKSAESDAHQRDLGDRPLAAGEDNWSDVEDSRPQFLLQPASPRPSSPQTHGGYFNATHDVHSPLPFSPSPGASPMLSPAHSYGRRTPEPSGSIHSLHPNLTSSTTHLNASFSHPPHSHSPLKQAAYQDGEALAPTQSMTDVPIDLDEAENADMGVIAELARPGYPKLDRIVREEVQQSTGRVMVAACGPLSLGTLIRSIVSKQIDLKAIRAGRQNAYINVTTESYEWGG